MQKEECPPKGYEWAGVKGRRMSGNHGTARASTGDGPAYVQAKPLGRRGLCLKPQLRDYSRVLRSCNVHVGRIVTGKRVEGSGWRARRFRDRELRD